MERFSSRNRAVSKHIWVPGGDSWCGFLKVSRVRGCSGGKEEGEEEKSKE
jgi:hypothetical protein